MTTEPLKHTKCLIKFECSTNPFDGSNCVHYEAGTGVMGHERCKYWENGQCGSLVANANAMTLSLKEIGL